MNLHTANRRAKRRAVARAGHWAIYPLGTMPTQLLETRAFHVEEICRVFGLPLRTMVQIRDEERMAAVSRYWDDRLIKALLP